MAKFISDRQQSLKVGISSYTENSTVLQTIGKVGIGTTNAGGRSLYVIGDTQIVGVITATKFYGDGSSLSGVQAGASGIATYAPNAGISTNVIGGIASITELSVSGVSTLGTVQISSGVVTAISGVVTYYGDGSKLTGIQASSIIGDSAYAINAGIATDLKGGSVGNIPYQADTNNTVFLANGASGFILQSNGVGEAPSWVAGAPSQAITGITIRDETTIVGTANNINTLSFSGSNIVATASGVGATITISDNLVGTSLSISGISTLGTVQISSGIVSVTSLSVSGISTLGTVQISSGIITASSGVVTYYGDGSKLSGITTTFIASSGVSTNVSGGIASVTSLSVSGISTLGTVRISSGIITSTNPGVSTVVYYGDGSNLTGIQASSIVGISTFATNAGIATESIKLQTPRTFQITGDVVGAAVTFDGTGNVSIAATIQPNSVALGSDTTGDYVQSITGTSNQISVSATSGEGSTPTLSLPTNFVIPQDATVTRDLQVTRNLNVTGNITLGGTTAFLNVQELKVSDPDIVLGFRTDALGNDVSNDNTANHGGVALASTEGTPLVNIFIAGIETNPSTYKKIMWFKSGTFAGLNTDAWLFNYGVGIGSTQFPLGTRLAAGNVQFTQNDLAVVKNINSSGVVTATSFSGNASSATYATNAGVATYATNAGIATYATNAGVSTSVIGGIGSITSLSVSGISTLGTVQISSGIVTASSGVVTYYGDGSKLSGITTTFIASSGVSTNVSGGIASVTSLSVSGFSTVGILTATKIGIGTANPTSELWVNGNGYFVGIVSASNFYVGGNVIGQGSISGDNLVGTALSISGISTLGTVRISSGIVTASSGVVTYYGDGSKLSGVVAAASISITQDTTNQPQFILFSPTTGTVSQFNASTSSLVFNPSTNRLGIGTTNPIQKLHVVDSILVTNSAGSLSNAIQTKAYANQYSIEDVDGYGTRQYISIAKSDTSLFKVNDDLFNTKFVVGAGGSVGIGSTLPRFSLDVIGGANIEGSLFVNSVNISGGLTWQVGSAGSIYTLGRVGIGTTNPKAQLHVIDSILVSTGGTTTFNNAIQTKGYTNQYSIEDVDGFGARQYISIAKSDTSLFKVNDDLFNTRFIVTDIGSVGIGTTTPIGQLQVSSGPVIVGAGTSTGTVSQRLQVTGGAYISGSVGVGTTNPIGRFQVGSASTTAVIVVTNSGFVGLGTTNPIQKLHVVDATVVSAAGTTTLNNAIQTKAYPNLYSIEDVEGFGARQYFSIDKSDTALFKVNNDSAITRFIVTSAGDVGIGTTIPSSKLQVVGTFAATTKSFFIDHPTKEGKKLQYGSLESPYHGIRLTGSSTIKNGRCVIDLPDYIYNFVKEEGINIQITNIKHGNVIWVEDVDISNNNFVVMCEETLGEHKFYWDFTAVRNDVDDLIVEI